MIEIHLNPPDSETKTLDGNTLVIDFARRLTANEIERSFFDEVMIADERKLVDQITTADNICIIGGDTLRLINTLRPIEGWIKALSGKSIYAWSAGISCLAILSWNIDYRRIVRGFGIIPCKTIVHYNDNHNRGLYALLAERPIHFPILTFYPWTYVTMLIADDDEFVSLDDDGDTIIS